MMVAFPTKVIVCRPSMESSRWASRRPPGPLPHSLVRILACAATRRGSLTEPFYTSQEGPPKA